MFTNTNVNGNCLSLAVECCKKNPTKCEGVAILLAYNPTEEEIWSSISLQKFFEANGVKSEIIVQDQKIRSQFLDYLIDEGWFKTETSFNRQRYICIALNAKNEATIDVSKVSKQSNVIFNIAAGKDKNKYAVRNVIQKDGDFFEPLFSLILESINEEGTPDNTALSNKYKETTEAMYRTLIEITHGFTERLTSAMLKIMSELMLWDLDYGKLMYQYNHLSFEMFEYMSIIKEKLTLCVGEEWPTIELTYDDFTNGNYDRFILKKAIEKMSNYDGILGLTVIAPEQTNEVFVYADKRPTVSFQLKSVAKNNNGVGFDNHMVCNVYESDQRKIISAIKKKFALSKKEA